MPPARIAVHTLVWGLLYHRSAGGAVNICPRCLPSFFGFEFSKFKFKRSLILRHTKVYVMWKFCLFSLQIDMWHVSPGVELGQLRSTTWSHRLTVIYWLSSVQNKQLLSYAYTGTIRSKKNRTQPGLGWVALPGVASPLLCLLPSELRHALRRPFRA